MPHAATLQAALQATLPDTLHAMPQATLQRGTAEDGTPGHPVLFPRDCFPALLALSGDMGAKAVLAANIPRVRDVPLPGRRALTDLDTPEAWQAWESAQAAE